MNWQDDLKTQLDLNKKENEVYITLTFVGDGLDVAVVDDNIEIQFCGMSFKNGETKQVKLENEIIFSQDIEVIDASVGDVFLSDIPVVHDCVFEGISLTI